MSIDKALLGFDYNQALGVQYPVPQGLLGDNLETQMNVSGTLGGLGALIKTQQEGGGFGEGLYSYILGDRAGRQQAVNTAATNYANKLNILSKQNQLARDPYELAKLKFDVEKQPFELGELKNKFYQSSYKVQAMQDEIMQLASEGKYDQLNEIRGNPEQYFKMKSETNINNLKYSEGALNVARVLGLDVKNRDTWSPEDNDAFDAITSAPSVADAAKINREAMAAHKADPNRVPYVYTPSRNEVLASYRKQSKGQVRTDQTGQQQVVQQPYSSTELSNLPVGAFEGTGEGKYKDGGYKGSDGKLYTMDQWDKLGLQQKQMLGSDIDFKTYNEYNKKLFEDMKKDRDLSQYGHEMATRTNQAIERLLDDPAKVGKMFTFLGRGAIKFNEITGNFIATKSEAQDAANQLNTIAGQQFTNEIQKMRKNNSTGGAVGNVSDREVEMFKNMAASLRYSGTPEELYYQLNLLYGQGKNTIDMYRNSFELYYGEDNLKQFNVDRYKYDLKEYGSYQEELAKNKGDQAARVFGVNREEEQQQFENNDGFKLRNVR